MRKEIRYTFCLLLISVLICGCSKKEGTVQDESEKEEITAVKVEQVSKSTLYDFFTTNGNVRVADSLEVYSAVSGRLVSVKVKLGQKVSKGDVIAVIDPSVNGGNYSLYQVTAPISGTILSTPPAAGSIITTENKLVLLGDLSTLQIVSYVPERYYGRLKAGLSAVISVEAYENQNFNGKIKEVSPVINEENRTCEVILSLTDKSSKIVAGMYADVSIILEEFRNQISVPEDCVISRDGKNFVYIVENEKAKLCEVKAGNIYNHRRIIEMGILEDDLVITEGFENVADGGNVSIVTESVRHPELVSGSN